MTAGKVADILLMDVKTAFDHVSKNRLMRKMEAQGAHGDLVGGQDCSGRKERSA